MTEAAPAVAVIIVAAGEGTRLGADLPKAFVALGDRPLLAHAMHSVLGMSERVRLVVVAPSDRLDEARAIVAGELGAVVVAGGPTRQASVAAGLAAIGDGIEIVLVHDAARALTPSGQFDRVVAAVRATGRGAVPGLAVADTIKRADASGTILETVDRAALSAVQTPQGFPRAQLDEAYAAQPDDFTDDAALVAAVGHPVGLVPGDARAFKITTPWDLARAEQLLASERADAGHPAILPRIGVGVDTHAFDGDGELWVAGLLWSDEPGLAGHSDADPVAHAITDALLAAAGLGDIGSVFGTSDPRYAGAHGEVFVRGAVRMLSDAGFTIGNVSVQLIGNRPRFAARRAEAEALLGSILGAPVSIAATTTDGLGFTGRGEGVSAIATALIVPAG